MNAMSDRDYYPAGAYSDPNAPYNQPDDQDPININVEVSMCLTHRASVQTTNYDEYIDEEGCSERDLYDSASEIQGYYEKQHMSIPQLLGELAKYINAELQTDGLSYSRRTELEQMLMDCEGWTVNDINLESHEC